MENISKVLIVHNLETKILYLAKPSFKRKNKINTFTNFRIYRCSLKEILKNILQKEKKKKLNPKGISEITEG